MPADPMPALKSTHPNPARILIIFAFTAFIALGMPDGLLGIAWPSIRTAFGQNHDSMGILLTSSVSGYFLSSFFGAPITRRLGIGWLLTLSCALTGATLWGYTLVPSWWWLVGIALFLGIGAGAIDSSLNTFIAAHYTEKYMQWLHASYGVGITLGPLIMTFSLGVFEDWRAGYRIVALGQFALAALFLTKIGLWDKPSAEGEQKKIHEHQNPLGATLRLPNAYLSAALFFTYVGLEVTLGHWAFSFLTEARAIPQAQAGFWTGGYWLTFTIGRIFAGFLTRRLKAKQLFLSGLALGSLGGTLLALNPFAGSSLAGVALIGFALAPMYPSLMSMTAERVGKAHAANTIGLQVSISGFGAALLPGAMGVIAVRVGVGALPVFLLSLFGLLLTFFLASMWFKPASSRA